MGLDEGWGGRGVDDIFTYEAWKEELLLFGLEDLDRLLLALTPVQLGEEALCRRLIGDVPLNSDDLAVLIHKNGSIMGYLQLSQTLAVGKRPQVDRLLYYPSAHDGVLYRVSRRVVFDDKAVESTSIPYDGNINGYRYRPYLYTL